MERMEGHAAVSLNKDNGNWAIIINGWGFNLQMRSMSSTICLSILSDRLYGRSQHRHQIILASAMDLAQFTEADDITVYGGCSVGGYSGECSG